MEASEVGGLEAILVRIDGWKVTTLVPAPEAARKSNGYHRTPRVNQLLGGTAAACDLPSRPEAGDVVEMA
jgi:hypothetical protein